MGSNTTAIDSAVDAEMIFDRWLSQAVGALRVARGATLNQFWILLLMSERPTMSITAMTELLELNYTTVAECAGQLQRMGALTKSCNDDDRRESLLTLTASGEQLMGELDRELIAVAKRALSSLTGSTRIQAMQLFHNACIRLDKKRMVGNLVRGDGAFLIICQQTAMSFAAICKKNIVTALQGHLLLAIGRHDTLAEKTVRELLYCDAPTLSRTIAKMEAAGLITREPGATKREKRLRLTPIGLQCASLIAIDTEEMLQQLFGDDYATDTYLQTIAALRLSLRNTLLAGMR